jgi:hypothetical protein
MDIEFCDTWHETGKVFCRVVGFGQTNRRGLSEQLGLRKMKGLCCLLMVMMIPSSTTVWATNEGSYTYGYWQGSLTGPQNEPGLNANTEFDNNICHLTPGLILDNPKGVVIPAVTKSSVISNVVIPSSKCFVQIF